ncbi:MAG: glutathione S-transferase family protein [Gammaproteobacteria bacterium]|nr:glutathione S-transferase family protein [Gammaproteobacteria bacterium]
MEVDKLILYAYTFRSRAERVLWTLRELGYEYKVIRLNPFKGETRTPELSKLNPSKKIPVLVHGENVFTESLAIMEYLNDVSDSHSLAPEEPLEAFYYRKALHYGLTEIEPYLWVAEQSSRLKSLYNWPDGTYENAINQVNKNIGIVWQWVERSKYIASKEFSLADIYYYHLITWASQHNIEHLSGVRNYLSLLESRHAFPVEMLAGENTKTQPI